MDLYQAMESRRSIRSYKGDPVAEKTLEKILNAARLAPSWKNQQCWKFVLVRKEEGRRRLAEALPAGNPAKKAFTDAPVALALCARPADSGNWEQKEYYLMDAGLVMLQMMLAARAEGLGTCCVCWFNEKKAREACGVPEEYRVVALSPLGVPAQVPAPRTRKPLTETVYSEQWGHPLA